MLLTIGRDWRERLAEIEKKYAPTPDEEWDALDAEHQRTLLSTRFQEYAPRNLKIKAKGLPGVPKGAIVPLRMNRSQLFLHHCIEEQKRNTGRVRCHLLKGRQWGGSTYTEGRFYWLTTCTADSFGTSAFIFSHEDKSTGELFDMVDMFYRYSHSDLRPVISASNAKELVFPLLEAKYEVATAGKKDVGRSKSTKLLHWSEKAASPNAEGHKRGILQTVPEAEGTEIIQESTAHGVGGAFHEDWLEAVKNDGWGDIAVFVPWYWHEEYRESLERYLLLSGHEFVPTTEEAALASEYELDDEQIIFRRLKIKSIKAPTGNPEDDFRQEYPMNWQEAFLFSGSPVFPAEAMEKAKGRLVPPKIRARVDMSLEPFRLVPDPGGELLIWETPDHDQMYAIGADVAKGLEHGDNSSAFVVNCTTGLTSAEWTGHIPADRFGDLLNWLGKLYGRKTEICPEITGGYGDAVVNRLHKLKYPHIYQYEQRTSDGHKVKRWGFDTTKNSKPFLIEQLAEDLREMPHCLRSKMLWYEMGTFVRVFNETNPHMPPKLQAREGKKDDRVIARALASLMYHQKRGRWVMTPQQRERKEAYEKAEGAIKLGKSLYRGWDRQKSSTPGWKPNTASGIKTVSGAPVKRTLDDLNETLAHLEAEMSRRRAIVMTGSLGEPVVAEVIDSEEET